MTEARPLFPGPLATERAYPALKRDYPADFRVDASY